MLAVRTMRSLVGALALVCVLSSVSETRAADRDNDGIEDSVDNCPDHPNPDQTDSGGLASFLPNNRGNACECGDVSNDGIVHLNDAVLIQRYLAELGPGLAAAHKCDVAEAPGVAAAPECGIEDWMIIHRGLLGLPPGLMQICQPPSDPNGPDPNTPDPNTPCVPDDEVCDGVDNDCDQEIDEDLGQTSCGVGICAKTVDNCVGAQVQLCDPDAGAIAEVCGNGLDDNCNGIPDDPNTCPVLCAPDESCDTGLADACAEGVTSCPNGPAGEPLCLPVNTSAEVCDGVDNDCNGQTDEDLGQMECGVGACFRTIDNCRFGEVQTCDPNEVGLPELCGNNIDDDCDGEVDDAALCAGNDPPVFTTTPLLEAFEDRFYFYDANASDPEGEQVTYSIGFAPAGMAVHPDGRVTWTPSDEQNGPHQVELRATDESGQEATQNFTITVGELNKAPIITSFPQMHARIGELYNYDVDAFDPDQDPLVFSFDANAPAGMTIDPNTGLVSWTPPPSTTGPIPISVRVEDPNGASDTQDYELDILGDPLALQSPVGSFQVNEGEEIVLPMTSNYPDAVLGVDPLPGNASLEMGSFSFTPGRNQVGTHTLAFSARYAGEQVSNLITVEVIRNNQAPMFNPFGSPSVDEGRELRLVVSATDADGDPLTFSAPGLALPNAFFNQITRTLVFRPDFDQSGTVDVTLEVSDGLDLTQAVVSVLVNDITPPAEVLELVVDPANSPTFGNRQSITGNVTGEPGIPAPAEPPRFLSGLSPASARQGRSVEVDITGFNTAFVAGQGTPDFGAGTQVTNFEVFSPTSARASIQVDADARLGTRQVKISGRGGEIYSVVAFNITEGAATIAGKIIDRFTDQPLAGVRITINGTSISTTTDPNGSFLLDDVPSGQQTLLLMLANFKVKKIELAVGANQEISLGDPVGLGALARPALPAGSLPRAATPASVLDRGVSSKDGGLDLEQAIEVVSDTYLAVGGSDVGLLDENGEQLNPNVLGEGILSLTPLGIESHARALIQGDTTTLQEFVWVLSHTFRFLGGPLDEVEAIAAWQEAVNVAWGEPENPLNAMALIIFNDGTQLSVDPPVLGPKTPLNRFQAALLMQSFLVTNQHILAQSVDEQLILLGEDPNTFLADASDASTPESKFIASLRSFGRTLDSGAEYLVGVPEAQAQGAGITLASPNAGGIDNPFRTRTFTRVMSYSQNGFIADATIGTAISAAIAITAQVGIAYMTGATGGALGLAAATAFVGAAYGGIMDAVIQKLIFGLGLATASAAIEPQPPIPESSFIEGDKLVIVFEPSSSENQPIPTAPGGGNLFPPEWFRYTYQLYAFPNPDTTDIKQAEQVTASLEPSPRFPGKLQFNVPLGPLRVGVHFFRIATVQYVSNSEISLNESQIVFKLQDQLGVNDPSITPGTLVKTKFDLDEAVRIQTEIRATLNLNARLGGVDIDSDLFVSKLELDLVGELQDDLDRGTRAGRQAFINNNGTALEQATQLKKLAVEHGRSGADPFDLTREGRNVNFQARSIVGNQANSLPGNTENLITGIAVQAKEQDLQTRRVNSAMDSLADLNGFEAEIEGFRNAGAAEVVTVKYDRLSADGSFVQQVELDVNTANPDDLQAFQQLVDEENAVLKDARPKLESAKAEVNRLSDDLVADRVGPNWEAEKIRVQEAAEEVRTLERQKTDAQSRYRTAEDELFRERNRVNNEIRNEPRFKNHAPTVKKITTGVRVVGGVLTANELAKDFVKAFRVIYSSFSAVHMFTNFQRTTPLFDIEPHPNLFNFRGVIAGRKGQLLVDPNTGEETDQRKMGWIRTFYPDASELSAEFSAGFPPDFLAVDPNGLIYANNANSNQRFGGRMFRFQPKRPHTRQFAGAINYFSSTILYARPASPLAGAIGEVEFLGQIIPAYFVANIDFLDSGDNVLLNGGTKEIRVLAVGALDSHPQIFQGPLGVNRPVSQSLIQSPAFAFTGPTDMEIGPRKDQFQRIYVSDEDFIWLIKHDVFTNDVTLFPLIQEAGRRWSGMAFDEAENFYFADFNSGDIFHTTFDELLLLEQSSAAFVGVPILTVNDAPFDIELDQERRKLIVSTMSEIQAHPLPLIIPKPPLISAVRVVNFTKERDVPVRFDRNGQAHFVVPLTPFNLNRRDVRIRIQELTAQGIEWRDVVVPLAPTGATRIELELE